MNKISTYKKFRENIIELKENLHKEILRLRYENNIVFDNLKNGPAYKPNGNNALNLLNNAFFTDGFLLNVKILSSLN